VVKTGLFWREKTMGGGTGSRLMKLQHFYFQRLKETVRLWHRREDDIDRHLIRGGIRINKD